VFDGYLQASIGQLLLRARALNGDFEAACAGVSRSMAEVLAAYQAIIKGLDALLNDKRYLAPDAAPERLRAYKRLVGDLDFLESVAFAALKRQNDEDLRMTQLVGEIAREINFKLPPRRWCRVNHRHTSMHIHSTTYSLSRRRKSTFSSIYPTSTTS
jgi:hypothetical protein